MSTAREHIWSIADYQLGDLLKLSKGNRLSANVILPQIQNFNAFQDVPELKIPAYFCVSKYDYDTVSELAEKYYDQIVTPKIPLIDNKALNGQFNSVIKSFIISYQMIKSYIHKHSLLLEVLYGEYSI